MNKFTKTYNVEINENQRQALSSAFKMVAQYFLNEQKIDVEVIVNSFDSERLIAQLVAGGKVVECRLIGSKGGLTFVDSK